MAAEVDEGMARGMAWRRETVVGVVYTATGETHFVHRSGIYRGGGERRERVGRVETRARASACARRGTGGWGSRGLTGVRAGQTFHRCSEQDGRRGRQCEREVGLGGGRGVPASVKQVVRRWEGSWVAAEYGVIGEISRGSSTAANARERRFVVALPAFLPLSFSLCLAVCLSHDLFSVIQLSRTLRPSLALEAFCISASFFLYMYM